MGLILIDCLKNLQLIQPLLNSRFFVQAQNLQINVCLVSNTSLKYIPPEKQSWLHVEICYLPFHQSAIIDSKYDLWKAINFLFSKHILLHECKGVMFSRKAKQDRKRGKNSHKRYTN